MPKQNPFDLLGLLKVKNPFRNPTAEEKKLQAQKEKEVKEGIQRIAAICNDILSDQRYREFADLFRNIEQQVVDLMKRCEEPDRDKFFLKMKEYQIKLNIFEQMLKMPHEFIARQEEIARTEVK